VAVTRDFADRVAEVAQLLEEDEVADDALRRLTSLGAALGRVARGNLTPRPPQIRA
jgi:hypothetical protein